VIKDIKRVPESIGIVGDQSLSASSVAYRVCWKKSFRSYGM